MLVSLGLRRRKFLQRVVSEALESRAYLSTVTFATPVTIPVPGSQTVAPVFTSSVAADFNGDGQADYATIDSANNSLDILVNNGVGGLLVGQSLPTGHQPGSLQAVALANGNIDLLFVNSADSTVEFYSGNGNGSFNPTPTTISFAFSQSPGTVTTPNTVNAADVTGDGLPDILVGTNSGGILTFVNSGNRQFNQTQAATGGLDAIGQFFNSVGADDVVNSLPDGEIQIFANHGGGLALSSGTAAVPASLGNSTGFNSSSKAVVGDFNNDGKADVAIVITNPTTKSSFLSCLLGNGDGTFQLPVLTAITAGATALQIGKFTSGGAEDLLLRYSDHTSVLTGNKDGSFSLSPAAIPEANWTSAAIGDFNDDGLFDAAFGSALLLNTTGRKSTKVALAPSANPIALGQTVALKATVTGTGGTPSGSVAFFDKTPSTKEKLLGIGTIKAGVATLGAKLGNAIANHTIFAQYLGDTKFATNISANATVSVEKNGGVPTGPTILTPTIIKQTLPASVPADTKLANASVSVKLTNSSDTNAKGTVTINVFASPTTTFDSTTATLLTHLSKSPSLKVNASGTVNIPIKTVPSSLIGGTFHLIVQTVTSAGSASAAADSTFSVAAPFIALSEVITSVKLPSPVVNGAKLKASSVSMIVTNNGNIADNGFTIDLSASQDPNSAAASFLHVKKGTKIAPGKSVAVMIGLKSLPTLAPGSYFMVAQTTDSAGGLSLASSASQFVVSA